MDNIFGIFILALVSGIALISLLAVIALIFPAPVERTRAALETSLGRSFLLGLVNFLFFGAIAALLVKLGQGAGGPVAAVLTLLALLLLLALTVFLVLGLSALASLLGERIGEGTSPFRRHLRGSLLLILAGLTPYVGWFAFAPLALITGFGAAIQIVYRKKEKPA
jgi:hypothetical protein